MRASYEDGIIPTPTVTPRIWVGVAVGLAVSLPVWVGVALVVWRLIHRGA